MAFSESLCTPQWRSEGYMPVELTWSTQLSFGCGKDTKQKKQQQHSWSLPMFQTLPDHKQLLLNLADLKAAVSKCEERVGQSTPTTCTVPGSVRGASRPVFPRINLDFVGPVSICIVYLWWYKRWRTSVIGLWPCILSLITKHKTPSGIDSSTSAPLSRHTFQERATITQIK